MRRRLPENALKVRILARIRSRGDLGLSASWVASDFGYYPGWKEALESLVESGRVERRTLDRRAGGHPYGIATATVYVAR